MSDKEPGRSAEGQGVDLDRFSHNVARLVEEGGKAVASYLRAREEGKAVGGMSDQVADVAKTLGQVAEFWMSDPQRAVQVQTGLATAYLDLWASAMKRMAGEEVKPLAEPEPGDKRFSDPDWSGNQFYDFLKQAYLIGAKWSEQLVKDAEGLDPHTRHKAEFYTRQITNALAPSNFVLTNPELLRETLQSNAENLVRGMHMLAEDIEAGKGQLKIRQSDSSMFEVGRNLALTPGKVVFQNELFQLIQYAPTTDKVLKRPLLIVPPWINKYYILDLTPEKSLVKWCVDQGVTVFMVSWANPDARLAERSFEHYVFEGTLKAIDVVAALTREKQINAVGYCVGGTLLAVTLAYMAATGDTRVASTTFLASQVDFTYAGDLLVFVDEEQIQRLEKEMQERGYLAGSKMALAFNMLRSNDLIWPYIINSYLKGKAPFPFDLLYWNSDSTRMPAANHSFYLRNCYLDNKLVKGEMTIGGEKLDLKRVTMPVYNIATREDHIAPAKSAFFGSQFFGGPVRFVLAGSGHIAGIVNPPSKVKYQHWIGGKPEGDLESWIANANEHPGSWWPDWMEWLKALDGMTVAARKIGSAKFKPIEDAPGSYVKERD